MNSNRHPASGRRYRGMRWIGFSDSQSSLIEQLDLNSPRLKEWRVMWMRIVALSEEHKPELFHRLVGFPNDLPDLSKLRPPYNARKQGIGECWFARRQRGELPSVY